MFYTKTSIIDNLLEINVYDNNGTDVSTTVDINAELYAKTGDVYTFLTRVKSSRQTLGLKLLENDYIYITLYINDQLIKTLIKTEVKIKSVVTRYIISYKVHSAITDLSNSLLSRFNYFMPKWSTAYKNKISNFSRIFYPFYLNNEILFYKIQESLENNLRNLVTYKEYKPLPNSVFKIVDKTSNEVRFSLSPYHSKINKVEISPYKDISSHLFKEIYLTLSTPLYLKASCSTLYIEGFSGTTVYIKGVTLEGVLTTETLVFNSHYIRCSKFQYKKIFSIQSNNKDIIVSNYLDLKSQINYYEFFRAPTSYDLKNQPSFDYIYMEGADVLCNKEDYYQIDCSIQNVFKTYTNDLIILDDNNNLRVGLLNRDFAPQLTLLENNNNNKYISIEEFDISTKSITFVIDTANLYNDLQNTYGTINISTDKDSYYVNQEKSLVFDKTHINFSKFNKLRLSINFSDYKFLNVILEVNGFKFQSSYICNYINTSIISTKWDSIFIVNNKLIGFQDNSYFDIKLSKNYYEIDSDYLILNSPATIS